MQEESCVLDNFHCSYFALDHWSGCGVWTRSDAVAAGSGYDFRFNEFRLPAHIFELTG